MAFHWGEPLAFVASAAWTISAQPANSFQLADCCFRDCSRISLLVCRLSHSAVKFCTSTCRKRQAIRSPITCAQARWFEATVHDPPVSAAVQHLKWSHLDFPYSEPVDVRSSYSSCYTETIHCNLHRIPACSYCEEWGEDGHRY